MRHWGTGLRSVLSQTGGSAGGGLQNRRQRVISASGGWDGVTQGLAVADRVAREGLLGEVAWTGGDLTAEKEGVGIRRPQGGALGLRHGG